jgi:hypothetical protein
MSNLDLDLPWLKTVERMMTAPSVCPLCAQEWNGECPRETCPPCRAEDRRQTQAWFRANAARYLDALGIPPTYQRYRPSTWPGPQHTLQQAFAWGKDLLIVGPTGTGKTGLATAVLRHQLIAPLFAPDYYTDFDSCHRALGELRPSFWIMDDLVRQLKLQMNGGRAQSPEALLEELAARPLLVLDEIILGEGSPWGDEQVRSLLASRYAAGRRTILTTNMTYGAFIAEVGDRLASRIQEKGGRYRIIPLDGADRRTA